MSITHETQRNCAVCSFIQWLFVKYVHSELDIYVINKELQHTVSCLTKCINSWIKPIDIERYFPFTSRKSWKERNHRVFFFYLNHWVFLGSNFYVLSRYKNKVHFIRDNLTLYPTFKGPFEPKLSVLVNFANYDINMKRKCRISVQL